MADYSRRQFGILVICTIIHLSNSGSSPALKCGPKEHNLNNQRCCQTCSPGDGVLRACTPTNNTHCQACIFGESYSTVHSHVEVCQPCGYCPEYAHTVTPCNKTHDTICECDQNYFLDRVSQKCRPCQYCPMEYGVKQACNQTHDNVCRRCPEGHFSDRLGTEPCRPCGVCRMNQILLQHCSPGQDAICIDIPISTPWPQDALTDSSFPSGRTRQTKTNAIPIYCAILGCLILALIVYVIIKQNRRRQLLKNKSQNLSTSTSADCPPLLSGTPSSAGFMSKHGSDSGVYVDHDRPVTNVTRIKDLPPIRRKALENSMHGCRDDQGGWRTLAKQLGFNLMMISNIESKAKIDGFSPMHIFLNEWIQRDNALVCTLVNALRQIHRDDCVHVLCGDNRDYIAAPRYTDLGALHSQVI